MGLSVSIASAIVLVGWIAFVGTISATMLTAVNDIGSLVNSTSSDDIRLSVQLGLRIEGVESRSINISVLNIGSRDIFLRNETFAWNTVIVTYNNTDWQTYLIENYTVLTINVAGTNESFDVASHQSIKPGEQALVEIDMPTGTPEILTGSIVNVVFASHYGVSVAQEIFVSTYGPQISTSLSGYSIGGGRPG
jgi:archaellum component FlaF (FlaF/FlaG flagellin family)